MLETNFAGRGGSARPGSPPRIERYAFESVLGSGAMGVVYRATDRLLDRKVAIKTIREELVAPDLAYEEYRSRFYREATIVGSLSHENIVTLYDVGETRDGVPFLAMELVAGASLAELTESGRRLTLDQSMWLLAQLASAIDYAHARNVIHRDVKPSNILVGEGEEAKITDFGVAKLLGEEFTRSRTRFGTPGYMAPEQILGTKMTKSADLFALAVVAFELLSGETPFPGRRVHTVLYRIVHVEPVFPVTLDALGLLPARWREVFARALAKDPDARYPTASELVSDLVELFPGSWLGSAIVGSPSAMPARSASPETETLTLGALPVRNRRLPARK